MNLALSERPTACCREAFRQIKNIQEQADCIVPDVYEDVGQIVSAHAQLYLKSKDVTDHTVKIEAEAQIGVLYITESRDRVRCILFSKSMTIPWDTPELDAESTAQVSLRCTGVQARAVNPRKISAQLSVCAELSCWTQTSFSVPSGTADEETADLYLRQSSEECIFVTQVSEKSFVVNEQLPLDAQVEPTALSLARVKLLYFDYQPIGSKLLLKGGAELSIGYETQQGSCPEYLEQCLPFSVLIDMPDEDCIPGRVILEPTAIYTDLGDAINGSRVIELELHATAQLIFERRETISFLSDAYSTVCPVLAAESTTPVCCSLGTERLTASAADSITLEKESGEIVSVFSDVLSSSVSDAKAALSASVVMLLRTDDGSYDVRQRLLSFEATLPNPGGEITDARIVTLRAERRGDELAIDASASLDWTHSETKELRYLSSLELDSEHSFDRRTFPSLTIARRGDMDLWTLAKLYHSSVDAIEKTAELFPMDGPLLLIPRA